MDALAAVCERVACHAGRLRKVSLVAEYFRRLDDGDLVRAVRFLSGNPLEDAGPRPLAIGYVTLRDAAQTVFGWDNEITRLCLHEVGDLGEGLALLLHGHTKDEPLSLAAAESIYRNLHTARKQADKFAILRNCFARFRPPALKYFVKIISGELRIGLQEKMVEEAVALAAGAQHEAVREAHRRAGDLAQVALAARYSRLDSLEARLFHPVDFMLAKPIDSLAEISDPEQWAIEDKYDGIRAQAHYRDGETELFTRGMAEAAGAFPEIASAFAALQGSGLLDGEIVAWQEGRALPFTVLQQRLARKVVPLFLPLDIPVVFIAYDVLFHNGEMLADQPIQQRRAVLENVLAGQAAPLLLAPRYSARTVDDVAQLFGQARARGNEGLVLKRFGSPYEAGRRTGEWVKWKQPYATLDVVITAVEQGHGKRATVLSDYTFAVRDGGELLTVGKAYSGLTDREILELTSILRASTTGRDGAAYLVRPEVVLEVAFDGIQKSTRHKSGFALRFPRIIRWRKDKRPSDADTVDRVRQLYEASIAQK